MTRHSKILPFVVGTCLLAQSNVAQFVKSGPFWVDVEVPPSQLAGLDSRAWTEDGLPLGSPVAAGTTGLDSDQDQLTTDWERGFGRYEIVLGAFTWAEAKADAERRGGHLATVINREEWSDLKAVLGSQLGRKNLWLGATDENAEGVWQWVTGEKWDFTNWRTKEPGNDSLGNGQGLPENYLMIWGNETEATDGNELYWNDVTVAGGGSWHDLGVYSRAAYRGNFLNATDGSPSVGFRVVLAPER